MVGRTVLIRKQQTQHGGNNSRVIRATVLSETKDELKVQLSNQKLPMTVKASEVIDASRTFSSQLSLERGVVPYKAVPMSPSSMSSILASRSKV